MAFTRVTLSIDEDINKLWNKVAKKHRITKSGMVETYLKRVLHELDHANISDAESYDEILAIKEKGKNLFDYDERAIFDQSLEDYKKDKLGN